MHTKTIPVYVKLFSDIPSLLHYIIRLIRKTQVTEKKMSKRKEKRENRPDIKYIHTSEDEAQ